MIADTKANAQRGSLATFTLLTIHARPDLESEASPYQIGCVPLFGENANRYSKNPRVSTYIFQR